MAIKCIQLTQVICDGCGTSIFIKKWQDARKLDWTAPIDGAFQKCPECTKKYTDKIFREAKLAKIAQECPLGN